MISNRAVAYYSEGHGLADDIVMKIPSNIGERPVNTEANTDGVPGPCAGISWHVATKFRWPKV